MVSFSNETLVGKRAPTFRKTLTASEAMAYAAATDDNNPFYAAPYSLAPPLALVTLSLVHGVAPLMCDPELFHDPMALLRLVHLEEDIVWHHPLKQGMHLVTQACLADIEVRSSGEILRVEVNIAEELPGQSPRDIASITTLMFVRGRSPRTRRIGAGSGNTDLPASRRLTWTVAPDQSERYAEASGDRNPIHVDDTIARASGLKSRILHGLCTMAFAQRAVVTLFAGGDPARLKRLRVAFARPVYMQDKLTWEGREQPNTTEAVKFVVKNQAGRVVCTEGLAELRPASG